MPFLLPQPLLKLSPNIFISKMPLNLRHQPPSENLYLLISNFKGEIAAVLIDDDATLKRFYQYGNHIVLKAENPNVKDLEFELGDDVNIRILGKAVAFQSDVR